MNEKLSFGELKSLLGDNITGIRPKSMKEIHDKGTKSVIAWDNSAMDRFEEVIVINVFEDGTIFYRAGRKETLFSISECGKYEYEFSIDGVVLSEEYMDNLDWHICLAVHAEERLLRNSVRHKKEIPFCQFSSNEDASCDSGAEDRNGVIWENYCRDYWREEQEKDKIEELLDILCDKEKSIIKLYYLMGYSQTEIADILGIRRETVGRRIKIAFNKIQNNFA